MLAPLGELLLDLFDLLKKLNLCFLLISDALCNSLSQFVSEGIID